MAQPTYPGVYLEETASGVRPIQAAGTSTAAFIGEAERGLVNTAVKVRNITEYTKHYGGFLDEKYLTHAVNQYFRNGGSQCYVVRVTGEKSANAKLNLKDRSDGESLILSLQAISPGGWGNQLRVRIDRGRLDPENEFRLSVFLHEGSTLTPVESFDNLSTNPKHTNFVEKILRTSTAITGQVNSDNKNFFHGFSGAGPEAPELPIEMARARIRINVDGDGFQEVDLSNGVGPEDGRAPDLKTIENVAIAIQYVVRKLKPLLGTTNPDAFKKFTSTIHIKRLTLGSGTKQIDSAVIVAAAGANVDATANLRLGRTHKGVEATGNFLRLPAPTPHNTYESLMDGSNGEPISEDDDRPFIEAFEALNEKNDVSLIAVPGRGSTDLVQEGLSYCERRPLSDCFYIADMPSDHTTVEQARGFIEKISPKNSYGAVYIPWLYTPDPTGASPEPVLVPPSGHIAGLYARTDASRGVWKAPAGTAAALSGVSGLARDFTDTEHGELNPLGVDLIRRFPASGIVSWGARTIHSDPEYGYVPVRRLAILLRVSIYNGIQWAVFEPNGEELWSQLRTNLTSFMLTLYRRGAFQGTQPSDAFFVKCDSETTTQDDIDLGIVNVMIGFAPLKPAEFVIVKISQVAGPR